jgi:hypothetical protein
MKSTLKATTKGPIRSKPARAGKEKLQARPPLGGRYSRSEGSGPGPQRQRHNPKPAR